MAIDFTSAESTDIIETQCDRKSTRCDNSMSFRDNSMSFGDTFAYVRDRMQKSTYVKSSPIF